MDKSNNKKNSESLKTILATIKDYMAQKIISERQIEKEMNITLGSIYSWRIGKAKPSFDVLIKLADYFNVSADYLLGRVELQQNTANNAITSPLLARISKLDKSQQDKVMAYIDGLSDTKELFNQGRIEQRERQLLQEENYTMQQKKKI